MLLGCSIVLLLSHLSVQQWLSEPILSVRCNLPLFSLHPRSRSPRELYRNYKIHLLKLEFRKKKALARSISFPAPKFIVKSYTNLSIDGTLPNPGTVCQPDVKLFSNETSAEVLAPISNMKERGLGMCLISY